MEEVVSFTSALQLSLGSSRRVLRELQTNELGGLTQEAVAALESSIEETLEAPQENGAPGLDVASIDITNIIDNNGIFDVTFTVNTVIIPTDAKAFKIGDAFGNIFTSNESNASTVLGSTDATAMIYKNSSSGVETSFDMPGGFETPVMPLPMIQAGIGLIKNTAIDIRYMPMLDVVGDGDDGVEACAGTLAYANLCVVGSSAADRDAADAHRVVVGVGRRCAC